MSTLEQENQQLREENQRLRFEVEQLKKLIFGSKRERFISKALPGQQSLFAEEVGNGEPAVDAQENTPKVEVPKKKRKRKAPKRNVFPASLERVEVEILPKEAELYELQKIGEDVTELLAIRPAKLYVKKIVRPRMVDRKDDSKGVFQAPIPQRTVEKGMVDESFIADLIVEKMQFHMPIFRYNKKLGQLGIKWMKDTNLYNWFHAGAESLMPVFNLLVKDIMAQPYIQADESGIRVLGKDKDDGPYKGQMWVVLAPQINAVAFQYDRHKNYDAAIKLLGGFNETLQVDGFSTYEKLKRIQKITMIHCMAHSRRKFFDALEYHPVEAGEYLEYVQQLYALERTYREEKLTYDQRQKRRRSEAVPILEKMQNWLTEKASTTTILPTSYLRKAINYALKRWPGLSAYAYDGRLEIDNNWVENSIRPLALGRKNYLFAATDHYAQNLAILYSLIGTCIRNDINVKKYIYWLLQKVNTHKVTDEAVEWLPHRIDPAIIEAVNF